MRHDVPMSLPKELNQLHHSRMSLQVTLFKYSRGAKREKAYHGPDLHSNAVSIWHAQKVIVKAISFIPHLVLTFAHSIHSVGNPDEVLRKSIYPLFVRRIRVGENH